MALEIITSWMEKGIEQGIERGIEQGRTEGRAEGMTQIVTRQLTRRFGSLPEVIEARIHDLSPEALGDLAEALLSFTKPADLELWLDEYPTASRE